MATFFNQATLTYNGNVINSNVTTGQLLEVLSAAKTAVVDSYTQGSEVTYVVSIVNAGTTAFSGLTVSDDLGAYEFGAEILVPLDYIEGSVRYFVNGALQTAPAVEEGPPLVISGINVPAGGSAIIVYAARVNQFAPLGEEGEVVNTVTVSGEGITPITASETVSADSEASLTITKSLTPETVIENGTLTYTFIIQNTGSTPIVATDDAVITDTFDPALSDITVTFNGTLWVEGTNYTYDEETGEFASIPTFITVPAATYSQDEETGVWTVEPGISTLVITGTV